MNIRHNVHFRNFANIRPLETIWIFDVRTFYLPFTISFKKHSIKCVHSSTHHVRHKIDPELTPCSGISTFKFSKMQHLDMQGGFAMSECSDRSGNIFIFLINKHYFKKC